VSSNADRDRAVDDALRRSRAGQSRPMDTAPSAECLDPETLALWVEDGLTAAERAVAERHVADCSRCQATLAALVKTAPVRERRRSWWQVSRVAWMAPLTAAAAALVIWIAVPSAPPSPPPAQPAPASATVESSPQPAKEDARNAPATPANPSARERRDEKQRAEQPVAAPEQRQQAQAATSEAAAPPPAVAPPAAPARSDAFRALAPAAAGSLAKSAAQANVTAPDIASPDPSSRWRITSGRIVERSTDGGVTWQEQPIGTTSALTAGSAPTPLVCWIVGQDGVVLLSIDGRTWRKVGAPTTATLVSVQARDERTATVTDVNGRTYATIDGGMRWTQNQ
jgi:hypothetical protein